MVIKVKMATYTTQTLTMKGDQMCLRLSHATDDGKYNTYHAPNIDFSGIHFSKPWLFLKFKSNIAFHVACCKRNANTHVSNIFHKECTRCFDITFIKLCQCLK